MKNIFLLLWLFSFGVSAGPVNINKADADAISTALKGIGPKKAAAIIQYRKEHGEFKSLKDLENVKGIGEKTTLANQKDILFTDYSQSSARASEKFVKPNTGKKTK